MQSRPFSHEYWMACAIKLAKEVKDEVPISALVVKENKLISQAVNKTESLKDPTTHAEMIAIRDASIILGDWRLNDCILYTTLEPCGMCAGAIINSRISKLVFGAYDISRGACGSKINLFKDENQAEVIGGILELDSTKLLKDFFAVRR